MRMKSRIPKVTAVINRRSFNDQSGAKGSYEAIFSSIRSNWSSNSAISARSFAMRSAASGLGSKGSIASSSALSLPNLLRRLSASRRHFFNSRLLTLTLEAPAEKGRANWQFARISPKTASKDLRSHRDEFIRHVTNKFVTTKTASKESRQSGQFALPARRDFHSFRRR